jgi:hypothetical protein
LRDGAPIDAALMETYGFDVEGLDDAWRQAIQAQPRTASDEPAVEPTPTFVPTIIPISGAPISDQIATPTPIPTSSFDDSTTQPPAVRGRPPLTLTLALFGFCCIFLILIGVIVLGVLIRGQNDKGGKDV